MSDPVEKSLLEQELEAVNARIEQTRQKRQAVEAQLRAAEAEIENLAVDKERYQALGEICGALDKLGELDADGLFWDGLIGVSDKDEHLSRLRERIDIFEEQLGAAHEKRDSLAGRIDEIQRELRDLKGEIRKAYAREERRQSEFAIVREASPVPYRRVVMPWSGDAESEHRFRRALVVALLFCIIMGSVVPMVKVPMPDPYEQPEIPERLASLVREPEPEPEPEPPREEPDREELDPDEPDETEPEEPDERPEQEPEPTPEETRQARETAESTGVLAFSESFDDLLDEAPSAHTGVESLIDEADTAAGRAEAERSLVTARAEGSSGGVDDSRISRDVGTPGGGRMSGEGVEFTRAESELADMEAAARPDSEDYVPTRTDEEIQIVFDRYASTLYRIYNTELRRDPTLRGNIVLRITIESDGSVSECTVESSELGSAELEAQIVARVKRFNFGPKDNVPPVTIMYPIDFLPAG